jgi:large subunit ribosomal protein L4
MNIDIYTGTGEKKSTKTLKKEIFEVDVNEGLMHRAIVMRQANKRNPIAHTKTRAEVEISTKKLFRQKGTGRARRGAPSTNLLRGGGITHGPRKTQNFVINMTKKERRLALFSSLTVKAKGKDIFGLESFNEKEPKTKAFVELLGKLPKAQKYLFVISEKNPVLEKSMANIPNVHTILAPYLNPTDIFKSEKICFVDGALDTVEKTFLNSSK